MIKESVMLRKALALIKKGWCQGKCAEDSRGRSVDPGYPKARKWCAYGAVLAITDPEAGSTHDKWLKQVNPAYINYNDDPKRKKSDIIALFQKAIALAKKFESKRKEKVR